MNSSNPPSKVVLTIAGAREANRRLAGVAAIARIVRELSEAGVAEAWLELPPGESLEPAAMDDVHRLAGAMAVRIGKPAAGNEDIWPMPADRLIPAQEIPAFAAGRPIAAGAAIQLDSPAASAEILRRTGKTSDGPISRWLNRPVSRRLSAMLLRLPGFAPLHATAGTIVLATAMFLALIAGGQPGLLAGGLLFQAASIFDGVDGEVARATFRSSPAGAALDTTVDTVTTLLFIGGLAANLGWNGQATAFALAAWGLGLFLAGLALLGWRAAQSGQSLNLDRLKSQYRGRFSGPIGSRVMAFLTIVSSRDFFALLFAALIALGYPMAPLYIFAAAATVWIPFVVVSALASRETALSPEGA